MLHGLLLLLLTSVTAAAATAVTAGGAGWVDIEESTSGILNVLEDGRPLNEKFYAYNGQEIPW